MEGDNGANGGSENMVNSCVDDIMDRLISCSSGCFALGIGTEIDWSTSGERIDW